MIPQMMVGITNTLIWVNDRFSELTQPDILDFFVRHQ